MSKHVFEIQAQFKGGLSGSGLLKGKNLESPFSAPKELKGSGLGTNPEELFASAAASCFLITLSAILQFQGVQVEGLEIRTEVEASQEEKGRIKLTHLKHYPRVIISKEMEPSILTKIRDAVVRTEKACIISQAVQSNIEISTELEITIPSNPVTRL